MSLPFKIVKADVGIAGVASAAQEAKEDLEAAIGLIGNVFSNPRQQRAAQRNRIRRGRRVLFRGRNKAATKIQALFRGHRARRQGRQSMQIDHNGSINSIFTMPPRRRRRGRRAGKRKRRASYTRSRRKSYRSRSKRRKSSARTRLRLYPGGYPKTHLIKLRANAQTRITTIGSEWASIKFQPANCSDPFLGFRLGAGNEPTPTGIHPVTLAPYPADTHKLLAWTNQKGDILPRPQPYGWDQWMLSSPYGFAIVEGFKTTLTFIQATSSGHGHSTRMLAGFGHLHEQTSNAFLSDWTITNKNVDSTEISDMLNNRIIKNPQELYHGGVGESLAGPKTFVYNYSRKKTERKMKKMGTYIIPDASDSNYMFSHTTSPKFNPNVRFIIADIGAGEGEPIIWNVFIKIDYTVRLMRKTISDESIIGLTPP